MIFLIVECQQDIIVTPVYYRYVFFLNFTFTKLLFVIFILHFRSSCKILGSIPDGVHKLKVLIEAVFCVEPIRDMTEL